MSVKLYIYLFLCFFCCSCEFTEFAKGDMDDARRIFKTRKDFILKSSFDGIVLNKEICKECTTERFSLEIKLSSYNPKPDFSNQHYPKFYKFQSDTILILTVPRNLFEYSKPGSNIRKNANSNFVIIEKREELFLSTKEDEWLYQEK